jgi:hypothetical protein
MASKYQKTTRPGGFQGNSDIKKPPEKFFSGGHIRCLPHINKALIGSLVSGFD